MTPTLVWFRRDLRLQDNPALRAALDRGGPVVPVYIWDSAAAGRWAPGAASRRWLHDSLAALAGALDERGARLILARGDARFVLRGLIAKTNAGALYWNREYEPAAAARDARIATEMSATGLDVQSFPGALLNEPAAVANRQGRPFQVFSAYWRHCLALPVSAPVKLGPEPLPTPAGWPPSLTLAELDLVAGAAVPASGEAGRPGEAATAARLRAFVAGAVDSYDRDRDRPATDGTSRLSAALHFGEITPRQIWAALKARSRPTGVFPPSNGARVFLAELGWREFAHHLLVHFPHTPEAPLRAEFIHFPWADDPGGKKLAAWQEGRTGYPIIDAGMRQMRATGWMHNRVRMLVASFLTKHLRLPWTAGAEWFWQHLIDADLANNTLGWQWTAGCGADAAPYFRIFAPVLQGQKFDPEGAYVRHWVPELAALPARYIHAPWAAPSGVLAQAGVRLGETYPRPMVDHATARAGALEAFRSLRMRRSL